MIYVIKNIIQDLINNNDLPEIKYFKYVIDYFTKMKCINVYGVSDYIRCCEDNFEVNIEYEVIKLCKRFKILDIDEESLKQNEYFWTRILIDELVDYLKDELKKLPNRDYYFDLIKKFDLENKLDKLYALHSICFGFIDQFQSFHRISVDNFVSDLPEIKCFYKNKFVNPIAMKYLEDYMFKNYIKKFVSKIYGSTDLKPISKIENRFSITYDLNNNLRIVIPKAYYYSPIFWSLNNSICIIYNYPWCIDAYINVYRNYFKNSIIIFTKFFRNVEIRCVDCEDFKVISLFNSLKRCL